VVFRRIATGRANQVYFGIMSTADCRLAAALAHELRASREALVERWLDRISARVAVSEDRIFPGQELLNHVPLLIDGIARYLEGPHALPGGEAAVEAKARELGAMRYEQGFDAFQILKEYELLGAIISNQLAQRVDDLVRGFDPPAAPSEIAACWSRLTEALEAIRQATASHFLQLSAERVREREERLRRFNRMVSHELKNHLSAIVGAAALLPEPWLADDERQRFTQIVASNAGEAQRVLDDLVHLSRLERDTRQQRNVLLPQAAAEVARRLRGAALARQVDVRISPELPAVEVNAAVVEVCLGNLVSNAIKYSDPRKAERWVAISAEMIPPRRSETGGELTVRVRDNGLGVPPGARDNLFGQFYRAHDASEAKVEGTGLGLSIVKETVEMLGGRAWAEFPGEGGSVFAFSLPSRRYEDAAAAGVTRGV
jgi:signal transduction histidine kinase